MSCSYAISKDSDQTALMCSLINAFTVFIEKVRIAAANTGYLLSNFCTNPVIPVSTAYHLCSILIFCKVHFM